MTNQLPNGWINVTLGELGRTVTGKTPSTKVHENFNGSIPFIKPSDLDNGGYIHTTAETLSEKGLKCVSSLPIGAITVTCIGNLGKIGITTKISATNQQINSVICDEKMHSKYIYYFLTSMRNWLENESSATTISIVNKSKFSLLPVKLPPLAEQKEIATLLDNLLAQVDTLKTRLNAILNILKRFRQSVLAAAVSGKLTGNDKAEFIKKEKAITTLQSISSVIGGLTKNSKRSALPIKKPYLRVANVYENEFKLDDVSEIGVEEKELQRILLKANDLMIVEGNGSLEHIGRAALWRGEISDCVHQNHLIKVRVDEKSQNANFLLFYLMSPQGKAEIISKATSGAGLYTLSISKVASIQIPVFSLKEQTEIVHRVEELFAFADQIEQRVKSAQQRVNHLTQTILAKAFRGELTAEWREQNPDLISGENSAAALLARIKAERKK